MAEKNVKLYEYAKKVNEFTPKKEILGYASKNKLTGINLTSMEFSLEKESVEKPDLSSLKNTKKMNMEEFDSKRISFIKAAYVTYKCCRNQNLHLFQFNKIYFEKKYILKGVVGWKLPRKKLVQQQLKSLVEGLKFNSGTYKNHIITWIGRLKQPYKSNRFQNKQ